MADTRSFYENKLDKNTEAQIWPKIKNKLRTSCEEYLDNEHSIEESFGWIAQEIKKGKNEKTIIYYQTIKQSSVLYGSLKVMQGDFLLNSSSLPRLEMLHSCPHKTIRTIY